MQDNEEKVSKALAGGSTNAIGQVINSTNPLSPLFGGTGISNTAGNTLTLSGGNALTLTTTGVTNATLPTGTTTLVPTTGTGATGTWSISITGTAAGGAPPTGTASGDLSGTYPGPTVAKINGVTLGTTTATSGNLLIGSGSQWVTQGVSGDIAITSGGVTTIQAGAVTTTKIGAGAVNLATQVSGILIGTNGGTGVNNGTKLITVGGNFTTTPANDVTLTTTGATTVTLPTSGTLATTASGVFTQNISGTSATLTAPAAINIFYVTSSSISTLTLPSTFTAGQVFKIIGVGSGGTGGWKVAQVAGQSISYQTGGGTVTTTTTGTGGSLQSSAINDCIELVATAANTTLTVSGSYGSSIAGV